MADNKENTKSRFSMGAILFQLIFFVVLAYVITSFLVLNELSFEYEQIVTHTYFFAILGVGILLIFVGLLSKAAKPSQSSSNSAKLDSNIEKFYNSKWVTKELLKKLPQFMYHEYSDLKKSPQCGIPIRAELIGNKLHVNMYDSIHTIVIGTTGSGKTTQYVDPTIQILSETMTKPCFVITDPKGEIHRDHSLKLKKRGYNVLVFDLNDPFKSAQWNPLTRAYELNQQANEITKKVKLHQNEDPRKSGLKATSNTFYNEWYELDGFAFAEKKTLIGYIESRQQILRTEAFEDLKDISATICPIESANDPTWDRGARDMVNATLLAMLEDSNDPNLGMTKEKFNFYNLSKILSSKDSDPNNPFKTLQDYFSGRDKLSPAKQLSDQVMHNAPSTRASYMGIVSNRLSLFGDIGVCYATALNKMELGNFTNQPTALFIKIPDQKTIRHPIATMFISQLYKILVDKANERSSGKLPRPVYFLLDEFGNMPKIEGFDTMVTIARGRRIFFILILQSYAQLTIKYGEQVSNTLQDNCNIHVFIASNDKGTLQTFSDRCGTTTVETKNTSVSKSKDEKKGGDNYNSTTSITQESRPLIYPQELNDLKVGEIIVYILKQSPIRSVMTRSYSCKSIYDMQPAPENTSLPNGFNEREFFYDISIRNSKILNTGSDDNGFSGW